MCARSVYGSRIGLARDRLAVYAGLTILRPSEEEDARNRGECSQDDRDGETMLDQHTSSIGARVSPLKA
jgi:hypothetical protein